MCSAVYLMDRYSRHTRHHEPFDIFTMHTPTSLLLFYVFDKVYYIEKMKVENMTKQIFYPCMHDATVAPLIDHCIGLTCLVAYMNYCNMLIYMLVKCTFLFFSVSFPVPSVIKYVRSRWGCYMC